MQHQPLGFRGGPTSSRDASHGTYQKDTGGAWASNPVNSIGANPGPGCRNPGPGREVAKILFQVEWFPSHTNTQKTCRDDVPCEVYVPEINWMMMMMIACSDGPPCSTPTKNPRRFNKTLWPGPRTFPQKFMESLRGGTGTEVSGALVLLWGGSPHGSIPIPAVAHGKLKTRTECGILLLAPHFGCFPFHWQLIYGVGHVSNFHSLHPSFSLETTHFQPGFTMTRTQIVGISNPWDSNQRYTLGANTIVKKFHHLRCTRRALI